MDLAPLAGASEPDECVVCDNAGLGPSASVRRPSGDSSLEREGARRGRRRVVRTSEIGHGGTELVTSPRVVELMEEYGASELGKSLVVGRAATKMKRLMEELITDELDAYRVIVRESGVDKEDDAVSSMRDKVMSLDEMKQERLLMQRLGFVEHADVLTERIDKLQERRRVAAEEQRAEARERRMRDLEAQHEQRIESLEEALDRERQELLRQQAGKEAALVEVHRHETEVFLERTLRTATCNDVSATVCQCPNPWVCRHNRTATYKLRKTNPEVVRLRNAAAKLRKNRRREESLEFSDKADDIDKREAVAWTLRTQEAATRNGLPLLISKQASATQDLKDRHRHTLLQVDKEASRALENLKRVLACEREKFATKMKKVDRVAVQ